MKSRMGVATKNFFTCFFRGGKGETGGKDHYDKAQSFVKKLKYRESEPTSDIVTAGVNVKDIKQYIKVEKFRKEEERKKQEQYMKKNA